MNHTIKLISMMVFLGIIFVQASYHSDAYEIVESPPSGTRILNGQNTTKGEFPWMVSLQLEGEHICGGAIVNNRKILTAAHCFSKLSRTMLENLRVDVGRYRLDGQGDEIQSIDVDLIYIPGNYIFENYTTSDIAVMKLKEDILFRDNKGSIGAVSLVKLPKQDSGDDIRPPPTNLFVSGFGVSNHKDKTVSEILQKFVIQNVIYCPSFYDKYHFAKYYYYCVPIYKDDPDTGSGDSGSGVILGESKKPQVVAIVSAGIDDEVSFYTRVAPFVDWINEPERFMEKIWPK